MTASVRKSAPDQALLTPPQTPWQRERVRGPIVPLVPVYRYRQRARGFSNVISRGAILGVLLVVAYHIGCIAVIWAVSK